MWERQHRAPEPSKTQGHGSHCRGLPTWLPTNRPPSPSPLGEIGKSAQILRRLAMLATLAASRFSKNKLASTVRQTRATRPQCRTFLCAGYN